MKKILLFFLISFIIGLQMAEAQNEKFKALFMYNFTKYLEWPASASQGDFVITVLGDSPIVDELNVIAQKKQIGFQNLKVKQSGSPAQIPPSQIVYIPSDRTDQIKQVLEKVSDSSTLVITDAVGAIGKGAGINYIVQGEKQKFEISESNISARGIKVGAALLSLGISK